MPKPLFTRGETKKRQFGKTTMSDDGMKYFKKGISNWKMAFNDRGGELYETLVLTLKVVGGGRTSTAY